LSFEYVPAKGRLVEELRAEDILILQDGVPQKAALFEGGKFHPRSVPIEFALLFDGSGSVRLGGDRNPELFHSGLLQEFPQASIGIYGFSDTLTRLTRPTRNATVLAKAVEALYAIPIGATPLFQQIENTLRDFASVPSPALRMLVVVSDGESWPPQDAARAPNAARLANELGVPIHPVLLPLRSRAAAPPRPVERPKTRLPSAQDLELANSTDSIAKFTGLAKQTGGVQISVLESESLLPALLAKMARQTRFLYVAGYYPTAAGGRRKAEVVLASKGLGRIERGERTVRQ
jgi:hypothetical protein